MAMEEANSTVIKHGSILITVIGMHACMLMLMEPVMVVKNSAWPYSYLVMLSMTDRFG